MITDFDNVMFCLTYTSKTSNTDM